MGYYESLFWLNDTWGESRNERQSGTYHPYVPDLVSHRTFELSPATLDSVAEAHERISQLGVKGERAESIARILLRSEALSSSRIEGLELPVAKLLEAEELRRMGVTQNPTSTATLVLGNTDMMLEAIRVGTSSNSLSIETICRMHQLLLRGTQVESLGGAIRTSQNWIGGNRTNPIGATYVPPRPERVPALLEDLVEFCNTSQYPAVIKAAIAHAQFETIHPFADGNGRAGRALVHVLISPIGVVAPLSLALLADRSRYIEHLSAYRSDGDGGTTMNGWIDYFSQALVSACARAMALDDILAAVHGEWLHRVHFRKGSAGERILQLLTSHPVLTVARATELVGSSTEACRLAIHRLVEASILRQNAKNRKSGLYVADDVIDALTSYERAASTRIGNTRLERPETAVPQRARHGVTIPRLD